MKRQGLVGAKASKVERRDQRAVWCARGLNQPLRLFQREGIKVTLAQVPYTRSKPSRYPDQVLAQIVEREKAGW
jgi:hypothetical protein